MRLSGVALATVVVRKCCSLLPLGIVAPLALSELLMLMTVASQAQVVERLGIQPDCSGTLGQASVVYISETAML